MSSTQEQLGNLPEADKSKDTRTIDALVRDHLKDGIIDEREAKELLTRYEQEK